MYCNRPENELSAGAGTNAHDGRGFRRPARSCTLDILAPEAMFTDPLSPVLIELSAVFDFVPSVSNSRSYYAQEAQDRRRQDGRVRRLRWLQLRTVVSRPKTGGHGARQQSRLARGELEVRGRARDFCFFSRARVFFGLPEDPFAILVVLDEPHWGCALRVWLWLCVHARSCGGRSWAAAAGMCMTAGALRRQHGDRLRLGAEVGGRLLFIPSAPRLSNPPMSLLRCT